MTFKQLAPDFSVSRQITAADVATASRQGFGAIVSNRPDGEEQGQLSALEIAAMAAEHGLGFAHVPVVSGAVGEKEVVAMQQALAGLKPPVLAFCRSGMRSATLWALSAAGQTDPDAILSAARLAGYDLAELQPALAAASPAVKPHAVYDVVIIGGGAAGIATAASLLRRDARLSIAIVDPAESHYYQPGWTMVGAGIFTAEQTRRPLARVMPDRVTWIRTAATGFAPSDDKVELADGTLLTYRVLVAAPGITLAWDAIPGLAEALGSNGVTSNYRYDLAPYTRDLVRQLGRGRALFSQPPLPIKCAGAPQKAMYLACDFWRSAGVLDGIDVEFHNAGAALFGVAAYVPALMDYVARYGIRLEPESRLVAVDGPRRIATFEQKREGGAPKRVERPFDMLHAVPPQVAPGFVAASPLAGETGFIPVDPATLRHPRYPNIFALGDVVATTNAKTAAAARKQAPVVAVNVLSVLAGRAPAAAYDGYGSCPLTVERGRIVLAEFGYGGTLLPSFPSWLLDGTRPSRLAWFLKAQMLPQIYWHGMLKGREWLARPRRSGLPG